MKKYKISFFTLLLLTMIALITFVILINSSSKANQEVSTKDFGSQVTLTPTLALSPTIIPSPVVTEDPAELFPASRKIDGEIKYGYINRSGEFTIDPVFDMASDFYDGVAVVTLNNKYCVIDEGGNVIFINDNTIQNFCNGAAVYLKLDADGNCSYGYIDTKGNVMVEPQYELASNFNDDNRAYVSTGSGKYALIDKTGKVLENYELDLKYDYAMGLEDGYLIYTDSDSASYGVITLRGETIFEPIYSYIIYLGDALFAMKEPGLEPYEANVISKQAIFNAKGEQLTDYTYYDLSTFYKGYSSATNEDSTFFIGLDGTIVSDLPKFEGTGTVRLFGDVISAFLDGDQLYYTKDKTILWQTDNMVALSDSLKVKRLKFKPTRDVLVNYPQIDGLSDATIQKQINTQLKSIFTDKRKDITAKDMLSVDDTFAATLLHNLLIIERDGYDYYYGAAHGMPIMDFFYIDITTGTFYQLKDLLIDGSDYAEKINKLITDEIAADIESGDSMYFPDSFTGITETQYFHLEEDAIVVYFYPYDIAAYAGGFPEFIIPFTDISKYINTEGAFWKSFH